MYVVYGKIPSLLWNGRRNRDEKNLEHNSKFQQMIRKLLVLLLCLTAATATAKKPKSSASKKAESSAEKPKESDYDKLFKEKHTVADGMFRLHDVKGKLYFEIPDSLFGREMLLGSTISEVSDNAAATTGSKSDYPLHVVFTRNDRSVQLRTVNCENITDETGASRALAEAVKRNTADPILRNYKIEAWNRDSTAVVVNVTDLFVADVEEMSPFSKYGLYTAFELKKTFQKERSMLGEIKAFSDNVVVRSTLSYIFTLTRGRTTLVKDQPLTAVMTRSLVLLPREPYRPRITDSRMSVFPTGKVLFSEREQRAKVIYYAHRWRLEPSDMDAWKRGERVAPKKQIVFYVDDGFPEMWKKHIFEAVDQWNEPFGRIGFKNAIAAKPYPKDDPEFDPDNLKYSCIRYVPAAVANAMGPSWVDPRSGEIINASVLMYNDVVKLAANWRFVQTAQVDERVRGKELPDDVFQESLEYILAHEVGHCLGLMHNMAASSAFPVDSLRSASFTQQHGTTPSIMDYARFNYVAQPGDKGVKLTPPDLGPYDDYVIKYAYTPLPDKKDMFDEEKTIRGWIDEKVGDPIYRYGRQQVIARYDPTAIEEDLGDDHIKAGDYGIGNLKYVLSHMEEWITDEEDPDLKIRTELYEAAAGQFARYVNAVMLNVGGIYLTDVNSNTAGGPQAVSVPKELQRASLKWVLAQMKDSAWLEQPALTEKLPLHVDLSFILRFNFCRAFFTYYKNVTLSSHIADDPYTPQEYMDDLYNIVFESTIKGGPVSPSERLIQRMFVDAAADVASSEAKRMKLGGIAEAYAPSVDEIALMGLDRSGIVERYLGPLREAEEEHGKGYVASQLWNSDALSSGYGWQYNVQLRSIDESRALFVNVNDRILKLLRSRVKSATGETRAHYQGMIYVLERSLFPSQKN